MASRSSRRQTIAKINRERAVKEKRALKRAKKEAKKQAAAEARSGETSDVMMPPDTQTDSITPS